MVKASLIDRSPVVRLIGAYRLVKALLLFGVGFGVLELLDPGATQVLADWLGGLRFAAEFDFMQRLTAFVAGLTRSRINQLAIAVFAVAALDLVEGIGLLLGRVWAEYLTAVATASLIPFEVYEVVQRLTPVRVFVLSANVIIVLYLIAHLLRARKARSRPGPPSAG